MKKEYRNVGPTEILGHSPGTSFTADIPEYQEKTLIEGGGLQVVKETEDLPEVADGEEFQETGAGDDEAGVAPETSSDPDKPDEKPQTSTPNGKDQEKGK